MNHRSHQHGCTRLHTSVPVPAQTSAVGCGGQGFQTAHTQRGRPSSRAAALTAVLLCLLALVFAPPAIANVDLAVGMPINIGNHGCSLGFFGFDARQDRLAVTAGHCSDAVPNEPVFAENGVKIGEVVAWKEDLQNSAGKSIGARGYTVVSLYRAFHWSLSLPEWTPQSAAVLP
jgi:hypothetical protein